MQCEPYATRGSMETTGLTQDNPYTQTAHESFLRAQAAAASTGRAPDGALTDLQKAMLGTSKNTRFSTWTRENLEALAVASTAEIESLKEELQLTLKAWRRALRAADEHMRP